MTKRWITSLVSGVALAGLTLSSVLPAWAQQAPDKSGPGVTRVSIVQGQVVVQRGDSNKQVAAAVNAPLLPGDYISTGANSRGELQFDGATAVRLGGNVQARITNDDPNNRQLQLADGTVEVGLVHGSGPVQVDTPSVTVRARDIGDYRISIGRDGSSWVTARRGSAEVVTPQRTYTLESGRTLVARGSASNPSLTYTSEVGYDSFDDFNAKRDQTMVAALDASPNLNPDIAGYDNLGAYGQWQDVSGYGNVWVPNQSSDWAPYSNGSWSWEDGYGWTWVDNEPWGWAPYHYGNWFYANGYGWAWDPPAYNAYPAWSPALVGFFGFGVGGPGWGVSVGFGYPNIGWYPIAPYAPFYPWWPGWAWSGLGWGWGGWGCCGWGFGNVVNVTHITNIYRYFPHGGVHGVSINNFRNGTVSGHGFTVNQGNIGSHVGEIHGAVPVSPTRNSLGFGHGSVSSPMHLSAAFNSPRFASADRALSGRASFDDQQHAVSRAINANHDSAPVSHANTDRGAVNDRGTAAAGRESAGSDPWQRFDQARGTTTRGSDVRADDARANDVRANDDRGQAESGSWGRFAQSRGDSYMRNQSFSRSESSGRDGGSYRSDSYGGSYRNDSYGGSSYRGGNPYQSSSRNSYPSYARGSNSSYSRGSYPSYSRGSSPSYSRGSYPSYSRGSYPSYGSGAYRGGGYSAPRSGGYSAPHQSGGGGGHPSGGGGGGGGGHGHPPR
jgi:hypothetical protein